MRWRWLLAVVTSCSSSNAPRVRTPLPAVRTPPNESCPTCCDESVHVVEVDPASTLGFAPSSCTLHLAGRYAIEVAYDAPPPAIFDLFCSEGDEGLRIIYRGAPVGHDSITDLADPFHTGGRENVNTVNYSLGAPTNARYAFKAGEIQFQRLPRARLNMYDVPAPRDDGLGGYVELGLDLRFEGNRRFRAALRICPTYASTGPVSDPVE